MLGYKNNQSSTCCSSTQASLSHQHASQNTISVLPWCAKTVTTTYFGNVKLNTESLTRTQSDVSAVAANTSLGHGCPLSLLENAFNSSSTRCNAIMLKIYK